MASSEGHHHVLPPQLTDSKSVYGKKVKLSDQAMLELENQLKDIP